MQDLVNSFIRGGNHHWVSDERLYTPTKLGGLNCIELKSFFKALQTNWIKRYVILKCDDYWANILDEILGVTINTHKKYYLLVVSILLQKSKATGSHMN